MPFGNPRAIAAPIQIRKPKVDVGQAAANRDMPDAERRLGEPFGVLLEIV